MPKKKKKKKDKKLRILKKSKIKTSIKPLEKKGITQGAD